MENESVASRWQKLVRKSAATLKKSKTQTNRYVETTNLQLESLAEVNANAASEVLCLACATRRAADNRECVDGILNAAVAILKGRDPTNKKDIKLNLAKAALNMLRSVLCVEPNEEVQPEQKQHVKSTHLESEDPWVLARPMLPTDDCRVLSESVRLRAQPIPLRESMQLDRASTTATQSRSQSASSGIQHNETLPGETQLCSMGFDLQDARASLLKASFDVQGALELLLAGWSAGGDKVKSTETSAGAAADATWNGAGEPGWTYRRGTGVVTWIYVSPEGRQFSSEAAALSEVVRRRRTMIVERDNSADSSSHMEAAPKEREEADGAVPCCKQLPNEANGSDSFNKQLPKLVLHRPPNVSDTISAKLPSGRGDSGSSTNTSEPLVVWLPGENGATAAALNDSYVPWRTRTERGQLFPPQDTSIANAKYVYASVHTLCKKPPNNCSAEEAADMDAVAKALGYSDSSGDTAIWFVAATRPIRSGEEILVEKYQQLESGVGHDGKGSSTHPRDGQAVGGSGKFIDLSKPRRTKRSAGAQSADASFAWMALRPSLDRLHEASQVEEQSLRNQLAHRKRFLVPPKLVAEPMTVVSPGVHRPWGGLFATEAYLANVEKPTNLSPPFCLKPDGGSKLSRAEAVQAIRRAAVLGKGVYISPSELGPQAGCGLFADRPYETGAVITVYDGVVERTGALLYDPRQRAFFDPKLSTAHTSSDNAAWDYVGKQFQSHWKDGGTAPGSSIVVHGFGGWPVPFAPVGLGAGAMVNAVFSCKGRKLPSNSSAQEARRRKREAAGPRANGSKLARRLGWAPRGRKRRKVQAHLTQSSSVAHVMPTEMVV